ncbi:hypothetical protein NLJ89_g10672 [Agrocybe chaxingu]|uniref:Uncharacterized protein n=1 Tax=Agrocybe chaxingu TaxID=84603 RepID=A0A9W8JQT6_9AGAR|nr:hypothetical protein NLJ89_g10672 [Agrocybe chaxingu]
MASLEVSQLFSTSLPALESMVPHAAQDLATTESVTESETQDAEEYVSAVIGIKPWADAMTTLSNSVSVKVKRILNDPIRMAHYRSSYQGHIASDSESGEELLDGLPQGKHKDPGVDSSLNRPAEGQEDGGIVSMAEPAIVQGQLLPIIGDIPEASQHASVQPAMPPPIFCGSPRSRTASRQCPLCLETPQRFKPRPARGPGNYTRDFVTISSHVDALQAVYHYLLREQRELAYRMAEELGLSDNGN